MFIQTIKQDKLVLILYLFNQYNLISFLDYVIFNNCTTISILTLNSFDLGVCFDNIFVLITPGGCKLLAHDRFVAPHPGIVANLPMFVVTPHEDTANRCQRYAVFATTRHVCDVNWYMFFQIFVLMTRFTQSSHFFQRTYMAYLVNAQFSASVNSTTLQRCYNCFGRWFGSFGIRFIIQCLLYLLRKKY